MRTPVVVALALIAASCAGADEQPTAVARDAADPSSQTLPPVEELDPVEPSTSIAQPIEAPTTSTAPRNASAPKLSIDDVLLEAAEVPDPWQPEWRQLDLQGYDAGPNQTDCAPYWEYDRLLRFSGAEALWWRDGGNMNNYVRRVNGDTTPQATIVLLAGLPETCPVTSWSEGDFFTIERLDLGVDGVVGLEFVDRSDDRTWLAFAQHGDLLGELRMTLWPEFDTGEYPAVSLDDFAHMATLMRDRLRNAGPHTVPGQAPATTIVVPQHSVPPVTNPPRSVPTTVPIDVASSRLAAAMLATSDLPSGWTASDIDAYDSVPEVGEPIENCPTSSSLAALDQAFDFEMTLRSPDDTVDFVTYWVGEFETADAARVNVARLATLDECDTTEAFPVFSFVTDFATIDGADSAAVMSLTIDTDFEGRGTTEIVVAVVGRYVTAVSIASLDDTSDLAIDIASRAVAKLNNAKLD